LRDLTRFFPCFGLLAVRLARLKTFKTVRHRKIFRQVHRKILLPNSQAPLGFLARQYQRRFKILKFRYVHIVAQERERD